SGVPCRLISSTSSPAARHPSGGVPPARSALPDASCATGKTGLSAQVRPAVTMSWLRLTLPPMTASPTQFPALHTPFVQGVPASTSPAMHFGPPLAQSMPPAVQGFPVAQLAPALQATQVPCPSQTPPVQDQPAARLANPPQTSAP